MGGERMEFGAGRVLDATGPASGRGGCPQHGPLAFGDQMVRLAGATGLLSEPGGGAETTLRACLPPATRASGELVEWLYLPAANDERHDVTPGRCHAVQRPEHFDRSWQPGFGGPPRRTALRRGRVVGS